MEWNPLLSPAVVPQSYSAASMSSLASPRLELPHSQGQVIITPQGETLVVTEGSSVGGSSVVPQTPTCSGGSGKSPDVSNFSEEDEQVEGLTERKPRSDTNTPDPDKIARSREAERRRRQLAKENADRLRDLVPNLKAPRPNGKFKKVGYGIVMQQAADYIELLHKEAAQATNDMARQKMILEKLTTECFLLFKKAVFSHYYSMEATQIIQRLKNGESAPADWWFPELELLTQLTSVNDLIKSFVNEESIPKLMESYEAEYTQKLQPKPVSSASQAAHPYLIPQQLRPSMTSQVVQGPSQGPRPIANQNGLPVRGAFPANPTGQLTVGNQIRDPFFLSPRGQGPSASLVRPAYPRMAHMINNQVSMSSQQTAPFRPVYLPLVASSPSLGSVPNQMKMFTTESPSGAGNRPTGAPAQPSLTIEDSMEKETGPGNVFEEPLNPSDDISQIMEEAVNLDHLREEPMNSDDQDNYSMLSNLNEADGGMSFGGASNASLMDLGEGPATYSGVNIPTCGDGMSSYLGGSTPGRPFGFSREEEMRYTWDLDVNDLGPKPAWWTDADLDNDLLPPSNPNGSGASANADEPQPSTSRGYRGRSPPPVDWNVEKDNEAFKDHPLFKYNFMFSGIGTTQADFEKANMEISEIAAACLAEVEEESRQKEAAEEQRRMEGKSPKRRKSDDDDEGSSDDE